MNCRRKFHLWYYVIVLVAFAVADIFAHLGKGVREGLLARLPRSVAGMVEEFSEFAATLTDSWGISGRDVSVELRGRKLDEVIAAAGMPKGGGVKLLKRRAFTVGYSQSLNHPMWVAYTVWPSDGEFPEGPRPRFKPDPEVASPKSEAYTRTGYDRGHLAPNLAIARRYGAAAQEETFYTSNICPQKPDLNQGPWYWMEFLVSEVWGQKFEKVWVIAGAVPSSGKRQLTAASKIDLPDAFYQIVVAESRGRVRALAVLMPQDTPRYAFPRRYITTIDELESLTNLDFFPDMPKELQDALESGKPTRLWPTGLMGLFKFVRQYCKY